MCSCSFSCRCCCYRGRRRRRRSVDALAALDAYVILGGRRSLRIPVDRYSTIQHRSPKHMLKYGSAHINRTGRIYHWTSNLPLIRVKT